MLKRAVRKHENEIIAMGIVVLHGFVIYLVVATILYLFRIDIQPTVNQLGQTFGYTFLFSIIGALSPKIWASLTKSLPLLTKHRRTRR